MTAAGTVVRDVLDQLPITDTVFHDLTYTQPLSASLLEIVQRRSRSDRVLLVGPNVALAQALVNDGRPVEIWHVPGVALSEDLRGLVTRVGELDALFGSVCDAGPYDVLVLPYVVDSAVTEPVDLLASVRPLTARDGIVLIALRRAGGLEARGRALLGRSLASAGRNRKHSWSWPSLTPRRLLDEEAVQAAARAAGFRVARSAAVVATRATAGVDALPLAHWLRDKAVSAAKATVPALRDTMLVTLVPFETGRVAGYGTDLPAVTVVVVGDDNDRALRIQGDLEEQTYPRELIEVMFAARGPGAANEALRRARGEIVAFTDDWSRPPGGWVESGVRAMSDYTAALDGGILAEQGSAVQFLAMPDRKLRAGANGLFLVSNSFYVRDDVLAVGGFDEQIGDAWGWDASAAQRLRAAGYPVAVDESAFVFRFYSFPIDRSWMREEFARACELPEAVRRDPALRRSALDRRYFASPRTRAFDIALVGVGLAVARRKPSYAVVLAVPWIKSVVEYVDLWPPAEWKTSVRNLRGILLRNGIWFAGLAAGSVRARRVVL
jgi:hypothetical protein